MIAVANAAELGELLRSDPGRVRITGRDTRRERVPAPPDGAQRVSLGKLDAIERLEPDDLTCSVQPGVPCQALATALAEHGLELGFLRDDDEGTVGGLYAADPLGPANAGAPQPRSTLLGVEAVLGSGAPFRSGARVVKSVAGFDVHKLLIGSQGRLFAAVLLHLKLRPRAPAAARFLTENGDFDVALRMFVRLRSLAPPLQRLVMRRSPMGFSVEGRVAGRARQVTATLRAEALPETDAEGSDHLAPEGDAEVCAGSVRPSRIRGLVALLPDDAPLIVHGGGRFETALSPSAVDRLLAALPDLDAAAVVVTGPRRGHASPRDPNAIRLETRLTEALDPGAVFA